MLDGKDFKHRLHVVLLKIEEGLDSKRTREHFVDSLLMWTIEQLLMARFAEYKQYGIELLNELEKKVKDLSGPADRL